MDVVHALMHHVLLSVNLSSQSTAVLAESAVCTGTKAHRDECTSSHSRRVIQSELLTVLH